MDKCFMIQPYDKGRFDKRYADVFEPAVREAGLEPYRIDRDPRVSIPINEIEQGIRDSVICFAEISTDNPNVWFELGYAIASRKELCLVCSEERSDKFPFDVQHRSIIRYSTESASDFKLLQRKITERLVAIVNKQTSLHRISGQTLLKDTEGLSQHEIIALCAIMQNRAGPDDAVSHFQVASDMLALGYTKLAVGLGLAGLAQKGFIESSVHSDWDNQTFTCYSILGPGIDWLMSNQKALNLKADENEHRGSAKADEDEMPF